MALTDVSIRKAKAIDKPFKLTDANGLFLLVRPNGSKLWRYRYRIAKKENTFALGTYPEMSLADARTARDEARALVKQGIHPSVVRQSERAKVVHQGTQTFEGVAREYAKKKARKWSKVYTDQFIRAMELNVFPSIGRLPIRSINSAHILNILNTMDQRGATAHALTVRSWCGQVFRYAVATTRADLDPSAPLKGALQKSEVNHARPLPSDGIADLLPRLRTYSGQRTTAICVELLMLTFVRTAEMRQAEWSEFDFDTAIWKIPADKMKKRRVHLVPLATQTVRLLKELRQLTGQGRYLFPNRRRHDAAMSARTVNRALEIMGFESGELSGHDFRATATTHLHEMGFDPAHVDVQLAHAKKSATDAAYNHAVYLPQRIKLMQAWADYVYSLTAK
ncbi:integrase arm-type DNA-binding domain-containing protein [Marinobacter sp. MDS2]|uniref:tyrosine-type recombinase/integrase n=1 Tax=Marinobacter sp. MDS2 TaxID=3065961 RepID=UPI00273A9C04|nr:integrase arm-type DNA-binding domain-containing protein [Marinobacter sp. MDS2]MDP4546473.1 tyrosine-type recombinase/integrase [Marinobacter sp. MDS2]